MIFLSNAHTHTTWCDGANTTWEMAEAALQLGFTDLGISSHAQEIAHPGYGIEVKDEAAYCAEVDEVRKAYEGRLTVLCGIERDTYSPSTYNGFDYVIGSNHYLPPKNGEFQAADLDIDELIAVVNDWYNGNWSEMIRGFYADSLRNVQENKPTIVGHFDLIKKFNKGNLAFDESSPVYKEIALAAMDEVVKTVKSYGGIVEINMGAYARGLCDAPYPAPFLLHHLAQTNTRVIVTGDSHSAAALNNAFDKASFFLAEAGFKQVVVLKNGVFEDVPFDGEL